MTIPNLIRGIAALLIIGGLSACQTTTMTANETTQEPPTPVEISALISSYMAANPGATSVPLLHGQGRGFILNTDNTLTFDDFNSIREILRTSAVTLQEGNRICMAPIDPWTGACLEIFRRNDGVIEVFYEFGNGYSSSYIVRGFQL